MISDKTIKVAEMLHNQIEMEYDALPQVVKKRDSIGFNVWGREAGRVEQVSEDNIFVRFYSPESQAFLPVFS